VSKSDKFGLDIKLAEGLEWASSGQFSSFDAPNMSGHKSEPAAGPPVWIVDVEFQCCTRFLRILSDA